MVLQLVIKKRVTVEGEVVSNIVILLVYIYTVSTLFLSKMGNDGSLACDVTAIYT